MGGEPAGQGFGEGRDLRPHPALGQIGHRCRGCRARDQGRQHRPARDTHDVGGHRGQFDAGVFEDFLDPLHLPGAVAGQRGAGAGEVAQFPDRRRRHQRPAQQPVCAQVGQPGGVGDIGFAARHVAGVVGVDQHHRQRVFEQVEVRLPVIAGRFHHHTADPFGEQVLPQRQDLIRHRPPRRHCRCRGCVTAALDPYAGLRVPLRDIDTRAPRVHHIHHPSPQPLSRIPLSWCVLRGGRVGTEISHSCSKATLHGSRG